MHYRTCSSDRPIAKSAPFFVLKLTHLNVDNDPERVKVALRDEPIMKEQERVVSFLTEEKILDGDVLKSVIKKQHDTGQSIIGILKKDELVTKDELERIIAFSNKFEFVTLSSDMVDPMTAHLLSYEIVNRYNLIPVKKEEGKLYVAMASPLNLTVRDLIEAKTGCKVVPLAATPDAISQAINYHFNVRNVTRQDIVSMRLKQLESDKPSDGGVKFKSSAVANAPITRLVSSVINGAIDARASDIHIEPQGSDVRVRYRVDGILHEAIKIPSSAQRETVSHIKILADMDISERRLPQDGHITVRLNAKDYDIRVSSLPSVGGEKIVMRILDKNAGTWSLDDVVASATDNKKFRSLLNNPYGMILLTGPTGSGKTTTLYSVLQALNTPQKNIVTVEDPVEYSLDGITQVQVNTATGMTFAAGLRSILRQDPDIILVGEVRDLETAEMAISAALTGHLVLSTLHTNNVAGALSRLVNLGIPPFLVASALLGAVAQRLVRTSCEKCRQPYQPSQEELGYLKGMLNKDEENIVLHHSKGCNSCYSTGYHGRKPIFEILTVTPEIRRMVVSSLSDDEIKTQAIKEGMKTLRTSGIEEVLAGATTIEELRRMVNIKEE